MSVKVSEDELRYFRARRAHLVGAGAESPVEAARDIFGAQSQVEACSLHALSIRTRGRPGADEVAAAIFETHELVRTWGQRGTVHLYDAQAWPTVVASRPNWGSGRRGGMPSESLVRDMERVFAEAGRPLVRSDLFGLIPESYVDEVRDHPGAGSTPERFAATRLVWCLAEVGAITFGKKLGNEQSYVHRTLWHDDLEWPDLDSEAGNLDATRRYFRAFGPASAKDLSHYLGARVTDARRWVKTLGEELVPVECAGKKGLLILAEDAEELATLEIGSWPPRMLPMYDTLLMGHHDKRFILPNAAEEKLVWKKAAMVAATVIHEGRIVATWSHTKRANHVDVQIEPLSGWTPNMMSAFQREASEFASHLGLGLGELGG